MVSFETPFLQLNDQRKIVTETGHDESNSKNMKRKWNDTEDEVILPYKHWKNPKATAAATAAALATTKSFSDIELHLETPLPSEWQRCLDIQSGEIHFYNTRTQKRTLRDPRESSEPPSPTPRDCHMSLDLELNLPCGSLNHDYLNSTSEKHSPTTMTKKSSNSPPPTAAASINLFRSLSTVIGKTNPTDIDTEDEAAEMVATACKRCHMLVMLCKSSPTCPNCKYVHPPCQNLLDLFKPRLRLSY